MLDDDIDLNIFNRAIDENRANTVTQMASVINKNQDMVFYYPFVYMNSGHGIYKSSYAALIGNKTGSRFVDEAIFKAIHYSRHRGDVEGVLQIYKGSWDIVWTLGQELPKGFPEKLKNALPLPKPLQKVIGEYTDYGSW